MSKQRYTELSPSGRAAHYREMARQAEQMGQDGTPEFRDACRQFGQKWRRLADELDGGPLGEFARDAAEVLERRRNCQGDNVIVPGQWRSSR